MKMERERGDDQGSSIYLLVRQLLRLLCMLKTRIYPPRRELVYLIVCKGNVEERASGRNETTWRTWILVLDDPIFGSKFGSLKRHVLLN